MPDLREQLRQILQGPACFMGIGNADYGDDGFGVYLAQGLMDAGVPDVIIAGKNPERWLGQLSGFDHVIFLDAVELGTDPGAVVLLDSTQMAVRFPQLSTHKISLGLLSQWIEGNGNTRAWLLGTQPESLKGLQLSPALQKNLELLSRLLTECIGTGALASLADRKVDSELGTTA